MSKLPKLWTGKTDLVVRQQKKQELSLNDKLANLRRATGRPETIEVPMRCAISGERALLIYTRMHAGEKFKLADTRKIESAKADRGFLASLARKREVALKFDVRAFDNAGRACPYCGSDRLVVDCSECHEATCGGTIRVLPNGEEQHTCHPDCLHVALLGPATHITGGKADRRGVLGGGGHKALSPAGSKLLLPKKETKALPRGGFPLLRGPKKR